MDNSRDKLRAFADANILIAGVVWPYEVLQHAIKGDFSLVLSPYVINEAQRVLTSRFSISAEQFRAFLDSCNYEETADPAIEDVLMHANLVRDVADIPVALAALTAQADCLISEDKDLTSLGTIMTDVNRQLPVYLSGTFLREFMGWTSEQLESVRGRRWQDLEHGP